MFILTHLEARRDQPGMERGLSRCYDYPLRTKGRVWLNPPFKPKGGWFEHPFKPMGVELQTCTFQGLSASKHHQDCTKGPPREGRKERNMWREREKRAKFRAVRRRGGPADSGSSGARSWGGAKEKKVLRNQTPMIQTKPPLV